MPTAIDERLIIDEILRIRQEHRKGIRRIVKGKRKASMTSYSIVSFVLQSQVAEEQRRLGQRIDTQQWEIDTLKVVIAQLATGQPQPLPLPEDAEDLTTD